MHTQSRVFNAAELSADPFFFFSFFLISASLQKGAVQAEPAVKRPFLQDSTVDAVWAAARTVVTLL